MAGNRLNGFASKEDLIEASKAVHDEMNVKLETKMQDAKNDLGMRLVKMLGEKFDKMIDGEFEDRLSDHFNKMMQGVLQARVEAELSKQTKHLEVMVSDLQRSYESKTLQLEEEYRQKSQQLENKAKFLDQVHQETMARMEKLLDKFQMPTPVIHVTVPEQPAPVIHVTASEQEPPVIHVTVPEQPAPIVNITMPEKKKTIKNITYDGYNRPVTIEESEGG